ncbi:MAG: glycerol-3-phosphate 1-O-acyltransferase PlsY [Rikenellaceae bacterium]
MIINILIYIGLVILAYLLGSIPSAVWIGKSFYKIDVREHGSHNAGTTNVMRVLGRKAALPVFLIDGLKGYFAVMLSWIITKEPLGVEPFSEWFVNFRILLIIASVGGHIFPIFAGFRGGKGMATVTGCMIAFSPVPIILSLIVFLLSLMKWHYVSLSSILGSAFFPIFMILTPMVSQALKLKEKFFINDVLSPTMIVFGFVVGISLIFMHRKNITRLRSGTESKTYLSKRRRAQ